MATIIEQQVVLDEALVPMTTDVPKIYMQEFWATAKLHQHSIHFKMDTKKSVLDLEAFREMLHISPRIPSQSFAELPFEEEILEFLRSNIDYAYLIWEDFVYQVEHKNQKRSNEMYYPRFTKVIIDYFMKRKPSIPRRNRINWHYVRDDVLFSTIKVQCGSGIDEGTEEESFDPIPRTPEGSEDEGNDEEDQDLRLSEEARIQEEEEAENCIVTSISSVSSFVTSMLNPISDAGVESIFTTASSPIISLQTPTPIMTPSTIATITTSNDAPIPPTTIPSTILENLPTFNSAFRFDERLRSLETTFFEYRQTNPFVDAVSAIPGIVHQYMTQEMTEAI
nr:hypothetical protein [Tanacetum cinerariifolium]